MRRGDRIGHTFEKKGMDKDMECVVCQLSQDWPSHLPFAMCERHSNMLIGLAEDKRCGCCLAKMRYKYCENCLGKTFAFDKLSAVYTYGGLAREIIQFSKRNLSEGIFGFMAAAMYKPSRQLVEEYGLNCIIPVPTSEERLYRRGYNQADELARRLNSRLKLEFDGNALGRRRQQKKMNGMHLAYRMLNAAGIYFSRKYVYGKRVLLIDDVVTTGVTVSACAETLKAAGAETVCVSVFARV